MADKPVDNPDVGWYAKHFGRHAAPDSTGRIINDQMKKGWAILPASSSRSSPLASTLIGITLIQAPIFYFLDEPEIEVKAGNTEIVSNDLNDALGYRAGHFSSGRTTVIVEHDDGMYRVYTAPVDGTQNKADWTYVSDPVRATGLLSEFANSVQRKLQTLDGDFSNPPQYDPQLVRFNDITRVYNAPDQEGVIQRRTVGQDISSESGELRATYAEVLGELGVAMQGITNGQYGFRPGEVARESAEIKPARTALEQAAITGINIGFILALGTAIGLVRTGSALGSRQIRRSRKSKEPKNGR